MSERLEHTARPDGPGTTGATASGAGGFAGASAAQGQPDVSERSVGSLVGEVVSDLSTLMRQELELAKAEVKQEAKKGGAAAGMLAGSGVAAHLLLVFLSVALMWALSEWMHLGWAALIVAVLWGIVAAVLYSIGRKKLREVEPVPQQTIESVKEDVQWAKNRNS